MRSLVLVLPRTRSAPGSLPVLDHRVLCDFEGLVVRVQQPFQGLGFSGGQEGDSLLFSSLRVAPEDRE